MDALTRRRFLLASGVVAGGAIVAGGAAVTLPQLFGTATTAWRGGGTLVVLTLYGGNDGLNTVVPYADEAYHSHRPAMSYTADQVLRLDDQLGLNPALKGFRGLWDDRKLAIVRGVGYPKPNRSHFRSMDIWQTGSPDNPVRTGWLGRWLDATGRGPLDAVSFEPVLPVLLAGARTAGGSVSLKGRGLPAGIDVAGLAAASPGESPLRARAASSYTDLLAVNGTISHVKEGAPTPDRTDETGPLAPQLDLVARCVEANVPTRVYSVSLGGFDTHAAERAASERLLGEVDTAVTAFVQRMARTEAGRGVVLMVYSEFGRRVTANASDGTDHGTAGPVFVAGAGVHGGFLGHQPSLTDLDNGDLKADTDFRDLYATLLAQVLGADPGAVLAGHAGRLAGLL